MRILFGPEHDGLHISPDTPGAYEWWYFDALSDDGRFALVAIFFLGTPMSPYYKAVVDGKNPLPKDWCGVFFTVHERFPASEVLTGGKVKAVTTEWHEQAYAYNLYREGEFSSDGAQVCLGASSLRRAEGDTSSPTLWHLSIREPGLWRGIMSAEIEFTTQTDLQATGMGRENGHTWVCVAPVCRVKATCQIGRQKINFSGNGYHDHNFGTLPWAETDIWYWGRARVTSTQSEPRHIVYYADLNQSGDQETSLFAFDARGRLQEQDVARFLHDGTPLPIRRNVYGFESARIFAIDSSIRPTRAAVYAQHPGALTGGPFYERSPIDISIIDREHRDAEQETGTGIGEVFRPVRLCGPIASRAMWTRIRRRS